MRKSLGNLENLIAGGIYSLARQISLKMELKVENQSVNSY